MSTSTMLTNKPPLQHDPIQVQQYTLPNGLQLFMTINKAEPRIQTQIAVRAGSKFDPPATTGLAHYLEHMLFKGTSQIGALDWEKEQILLKQIADLYEEYRNTTAPEARKSIYAQIDDLSGQAAQLVAANEYDKLTSALGAKGTNAYTWVEQTVFINDIPSNELQRWMQLESERFQQLVLRLFHTELETVYEEFNIGQDNDFRKVSKALNAGLFPNHPYGQWTTIGEGEHLKNPSHYNIQRFFQTYYVPNNMAIILAGDFDPEQAVRWAQQYFGHYAPKDLPEFNFDPQPDIQEPQRKVVYGQESPYVKLGWRCPGAKTDDPLLLSLLRGVLSNGQAGLIDLNLLQRQQLLDASAAYTLLEDYSLFTLYGKPRGEQTLEEVEEKLISQIELVKQGNLPEWMPEAVINAYRLADIRSQESNRGRANAITSAFILGIPWDQYVNRFEQMATYSIEDLANYASKYLNNNYVSIHKKTGEDPNVLKVEKPPITPVQLNREGTSEFATQFLNQQVPPLQPQFLDFPTLLHTEALQEGLHFDYLQNQENETFSLYYIVEMGKFHDPELALAIAHLPYLGTSRFSPQALKQEWFKLGLNFNVMANNQRVYVTLNGLDKSFEAGVQLLEHILQDVQPSSEAWTNQVADILRNRANAQQDKRLILRSALTNYARFGATNPYTYRIGNEQLTDLDPVTFVQKVKDIPSYEHRIFYYGPRQASQARRVIQQHHRVPSQLQPLRAEYDFQETRHSQNRVLFMHFPMVQSETLLYSPGTPHFSKEEHLISQLYNSYFGLGLSSIVFQEIRESKALAYATYAYYSSPGRTDRPHIFQAYVGTQPDKLPDALPAITQIIEEMPRVPDQIEAARQSILRQIESDRIIRDDIYWTHRLHQRRGLHSDIRQELYEQMQTIHPQALMDFHENVIKGKPRNLLIMGDRQRIDRKLLEQFGPVEEVALEDVFQFGTGQDMV
jgi:predicted Zn-dependent peptidase